MIDDEALVWIDGDLRPVGEAAISPFDHGLVVGDGAFETLQILDRTPFAIERHLRRLQVTLAALAIESPSPELLRDAMGSVVHANDLVVGKLRLTVTGGAGPLSSGTPNGPPTVIVAAQPASAPPVPAAVTVPWTRNESGALVGLKTTSYAENVRALRYAHDQGAGEALFANTRGELCEGTGTNVFVVIDGQLLTPPLSSGCLAGVTRELVMELVDVAEATLPIDAVDHADEVFLTSSTRNVQALHQVNGRPLAPGPRTAATADVFAALLARDLDP